MASCYGEGGNGKAEFGGMVGENMVNHILPLKWELPNMTLTSSGQVDTIVENNCDLEIDFFRSQEEKEAAWHLMNIEIQMGQSWPFEEEFKDFASFSRYFLSHSAFVVRVRNLSEKSQKFQSIVTAGVVGCFYVKPNFPGRCSHVCNGGFIVRTEVRGNGIGERMGKAFLPLARDLGYKASFFNLVFVSNGVSDRLWQRLGYTLIGVVPKVAKLKGIDGLVDAKQYYYDLTTVTDLTK